MSDAEQAARTERAWRTPGRVGEVRFEHAIAHAFARRGMRNRILEADLYLATAGRADS